MKKIFIFSLLIALFFNPVSLYSQKKIKKESKLNSSVLSNLKFRNIGPALMSGRVSDIAINPNNENQWYIAVGSGGVWKTENSGTTWTPLFDSQAVYSIGCITIDPNYDQTIWVGTGENVSGRHVGFGDGIYKSINGGKSWENVGLGKSEHISKIIVNPKNSNEIFVAVQGPLWSKGGERGFYKSKDGGKTWKNTLKPSEWTGVTDIVIDYNSPNIIYAATWQRHRNVAALMDGGPETSIYKSEDYGETWRKIDRGLNSGDKGKIGLAISPQKSNVIYAAVELKRRKGEVYRSDNYGESWVKMSETVSGGTGPHYYQELYADPFDFDKIYLMDVRAKVSEDGGKTFKTISEKYKHSDNHALAFKMSDPNYLLIGTDGGLYETFDKTANWKYISNLPVTQFYKIAVDDAEPFYNILGGTQDNSTQVGPSRTDNTQGIVNADWNLTLFADGHQPATEPGNPNIAYSEWQEGNLTRIDRATGEIVYIQPQPEKGESAERFNWDAPIFVSQHNPTTIYYASHRLWKSTDRGDNWTAISGDLTNKENRFALPLMDKVWGWDSAWDVYAMSNYSTITSIGESPVKEGLVAVGTDDGLIQISQDDGKTWNKIPVSKLPNCPEKAFVNDLRFDLFDQNTIYVALDNHKYGDYKPYFYKTTNGGKSWSKIVNGLGEKNLVWRFVQDHVNKNLAFLATEFGAYVSFNAGNSWIQLKGNLPTISFRDIKIQKRENDLVLGSFGRGIFILDDYSALRNIDESTFSKDAQIFHPRDAYWYIQRPTVSFSEKGEQGSAFYTAPNPDFGVTFTYFIKNDFKSIKSKRSKFDDEAKKSGKNETLLNYQNIDNEMNENAPKYWMLIFDENDNLLRKLQIKAGKGLNRFTWDLKLSSLSPVTSAQSRGNFNRSRAAMTGPGNYKAQIFKDFEGNFDAIGNKVDFKVKRLHNTSIKGSDDIEVVAFWKELDKANAEFRSVNVDLSKMREEFEKLKIAYAKSTLVDNEINKIIKSLDKQFIELDVNLNGSKTERELQYNSKVPISNRFSHASQGTTNSTYGPSKAHRRSLEIAIEETAEMKNKINEIKNSDLKKLREKLNNESVPQIK